MGQKELATVGEAESGRCTVRATIILTGNLKDVWFNDNGPAKTLLVETHYIEQTTGQLFKTNHKVDLWGGYADNFTGERGDHLTVVGNISLRRFQTSSGENRRAATIQPTQIFVIPESDIFNNQVDLVGIAKGTRAFITKSQTPGIEIDVQVSLPNQKGEYFHAYYKVVVFGPEALTLNSKIDIGKMMMVGGRLSYQRDFSPYIIAEPQTWLSLGTKPKHPMPQNQEVA